MALTQKRKKLIIARENKRQMLTRVTKLIRISQWVSSKPMSQILPNVRCSLLSLPTASATSLPFKIFHIINRNTWHPKCRPVATGTFHQWTLTHQAKCALLTSNNHGLSNTQCPKCELTYHSRGRNPLLMYVMLCADHTIFHLQKTRYTRLTQPLRLFIIVEEKETKHISPVTHLSAHRAPSLPPLWSFEHPISKSRKLKLYLSHQKIFKR